MSATFTWCEDNGAATGSPSHGTTRTGFGGTGSTTDVNWKSVDDCTNTPQITLGIPGNTAGAGMVAAEYTMGIAFGSGLSYAVTANAPVTDSTAIGSGDIVMNLFYN